MLDSCRFREDRRGGQECINNCSRVCLLFAAAGWTQTVAIRAGNLIDPAVGTVTKNQIILVKDKKIAEVVRM